MHSAAHQHQRAAVRSAPPRAGGKIRPRTSMRGLAAVVFAACTLVGDAQAAAQTADPYTPGRAYGRVAFGADVAIVASPKDDRAFFNYTDYELNALRIVRLRGLAEYRVHRRVS